MRPAWVILVRDETISQEQETIPGQDLARLNAGHMLDLRSPPSSPPSSELPRCLLEVFWHLGVKS